MLNEYTSTIQKIDSKKKRLMVAGIIILFTFALSNVVSFHEDPTENISHLFTLVTVKQSPLWLILSSIIHLQEYLNSSHDCISVIFIGSYDHLLPRLNATSIIILTPYLQSQLLFRSTNIRTVAYLLAIRYGARFIYELHPNSSFHLPPSHHQSVQHVAFRRQRSPFVNIHPTFTANFTSFSPGLPTEELKNITQDGWSSIRTADSSYETIRPLIQQLILPFYPNKSLLVNHPPVAIEPLTFAPFPRTNVLFTYDAFWGLVLFDSKSDIWRSWWVQRLLWDINGHVVFASSTHQSNTTSETDINHDMKEDANIGKLVRYLSTWKSNKTTLVQRMEELINDMANQQFCDTQDLQSIGTWLEDLKQVGYVFPSIKPSTSSRSKPSTVRRRRRTAVCMTGLIECIEEAWRPFAQAIRTRVEGEMDIFMYLSSTEPVVDQLSTVPLTLRLIEALRYPNFTVKVLFENIPILDPHFPSNCTSHASVNQPDHKVPRYYQQLFGLSNCFALVRDYERKHNIKYDLMVRSRADLEFIAIPPTFDRTPPYDINKTLILPPNLYGSKVDDGFAIGPIDAVEVYMNRYYSFRECLTRDLHPEGYLDFYLTHRKLNWIVDQDTQVKHIPHSPDHCH